MYIYEHITLKFPTVCYANVVAPTLTFSYNCNPST